MKKDIILLKTVKSFCEVAVGELELQLKYDESIPEKVSHPLYDSAKDLLHGALRKGVVQLMDKHNFVLPEKLTHNELVSKLSAYASSSFGIGHSLIVLTTTMDRQFQIIHPFFCNQKRWADQTALH